MQRHCEMQPASEIEVRNYPDTVAPSLARREIFAHSRTNVFVFILVPGAPLGLYGLASQLRSHKKPRDTRC